jgi:single-strand DNA-binding protein
MTFRIFVVHSGKFNFNNNKYLKKMALEIEGKLYRKFDTMQIKADFSKREFVIETNEQYSQKVKFELTKEKCALLDNYKEGDSIKVHFNLRGSEWQGKFLVNLQAWKLDKPGDSNSGNNTNNYTGNLPSFTKTPPPPKDPIEGEDDLPF